MEITDVRIRLAIGEGKLKAYAAVTFDDCFVVHNIKVLEGSNGFFLAMPSRKTGKGENKDIAHPINGEFRSVLQDVIMEKYRLALETGDAAQEPMNADQGGV